MNKRIVLVDSIEFKNYSGLYGIGLDSNSIYTLQYLESLPKPDKMKILTLGNTDAALLVGGEPFKYLRQFYHFGIRNENYADCAKLRRLSIEGGAFVKCTIEIPEQDVINDFLSKNFTVHRDFSWFKQKVIHTFEEAMRFLDYMDSLPENTNYGFDYEASGMPLDRWFEISGASISTVKYAGFISFTDIRHQVLNSAPENYQTLLQRLRDFLEKRQDHIWTYNMQYEFQVSHRMLNNVDLYNLCDSSVFNILDGNNLKKYSLKWTGNMILQSTVWDTEFDRISDLIDSMLFEEVGKLKKDKHKVLKVTKENYKETPEWKELCRRYPNYIQEFEQLILEYWGNPFMCIPSDILGYYCNLDSFYTLMIYEERKGIYTEECIHTFMDNLRLACRLHSSGLYIDDTYRLQYQQECHRMMAWGVTYCAMARCWIKMDKHKKKMANINKYNPTCKKLLDFRMFYNGDANEISKNLLIKYVDLMEAYPDSGLNEGALLMDFGDQFAEDFINMVQESKTEIKFKAKMDANIGKKKKLISTVAGKLSTYLGLDKLKLGEKHLELEKYIYYEQAYNELKRITVQVMPNVENIPAKISAFGQDFDTLEDYANFVSGEYYKSKSPVENDIIVDEAFSLYKTQSSFIGALMESIQQLPGKDKHAFFKDRGYRTIDDAYNYFMHDWQIYCTNPSTYQGDFPTKIFDIALKCFQKGILFEISKDNYPIKSVFSDFEGLTTQMDFFSEYKSKDQIQQYSLPFDPNDLNDDFFFMRKITINYLLYKKYSKVLSTYINGMFDNYKWVIEDKKNRVIIREARPDEPFAVKKVMVPYSCLEKRSKRWSSPFHTILSHSDLKDIISVNHFENDSNGNPIWVDEPFVETYFDISSAEVKSSGYSSGDSELIRMFNEGIDAYIYAAKLYLTEEGWNSLDKAEKKSWRKRFKQIFLGLLYGLGLLSLSEKLNCSKEEAQKIIDSVYNNFPKLREYVAKQGKYPLEHSGYVNTMLGDKLQTQPEWNLYLKAIKEGNEYEERSLKARIQRLGVNLPIQGGTSTIMSSGFFHDIAVSIEENNPLIPIITVH